MGNHWEKNFDQSYLSEEGRYRIQLAGMDIRTTIEHYFEIHPKFVMCINPVSQNLISCFFAEI